LVFKIFRAQFKFLEKIRSQILTPRVDHYPFLSLPCTHSRAPQGREQSSPAAWLPAPTAAACAPTLPHCSATCAPAFPAAAPRCPAPACTAPRHHRTSAARSHRCRPRTARLPRSASPTAPLCFPFSRLLSHLPAHLLPQHHLSSVLYARTLRAPRRHHVSTTAGILFFPACVRSPTLTLSFSLPHICALAQHPTSPAPYSSSGAEPRQRRRARAIAYPSAEHSSAAEHLPPSIPTPSKPLNPTPLTSLQLNGPRKPSHFAGAEPQCQTSSLRP